MKKKLPIIIEKCSINGLVLYPDENGHGITLSEKDHLELFECCTHIYPCLIREISRNTHSKFDTSPAIIESIVRNTVIPLVNVFIDTTVRMGMAVKSQKESLRVVTMGDINTPCSIEEFSLKAKADEKFNQYLVYHFRSIWNLKDVQYDLSYPSKNTHQRSYVSHMSRLYPKNIFNALIHSTRRFFFRIKSMFFVKSNLITNLSYLSAPFEHKGMFVRNFEKINIDFQISDSKVDNTVRNEIFNYNILNNLNLDCVFRKIKLNNEEKENYKKSLVEFLRYFYPLHSLEMIPKFVNLLKPQIDKYKPGILVTGAGLDTNIFYLSALLRERGFKLLRLKHGGYTGYYEFGYRQNHIWTNEFDMCDYYLTWGWSALYNDVDSQKIEFIPFISPWLSERKKYWSHYEFGVNRDYEFDVLIAPTRLAKFHTVNWQNSVDDTYTNSRSLISIVQNLKENNVSVLYKPPSIDSMDRYAQSIKEMIKAKGGKFSILKNIDKGLDIDLLKRTSLIVWDVVGFGFLECLACGIPTMVLIESYLPIDNGAKDMLYELEKVGIVHLSVESLVCEINTYKKDYKKWVFNQRRRSAVNSFSKIYCNTEDDWNESLMNIISRLEE